MYWASPVPCFLPQNDHAFAGNLVKLVSKTSLIAIYLVLATIWVIQLASTTRSSELYLHFQDWGLVKVSIPSKGISNHLVDFGSGRTQYRNLLKFAIRRKHATGEAQYMAVGTGQELNSQTYLSRIVQDLNKLLDQDEHNRLDRKDLFTFVGAGQYRLRVLPNNIVLDESLLSEFVSEAENARYQSLVAEQ